MKKAGLRALVETPVLTCLFLTTHWEQAGFSRLARDISSCSDDEFLTDVRPMIL